MRVADAVLLEPGVGEELGGALAVLRVADEALLEEAEALRCDDVGRVVNGHGGVGADVEECGHGREVVVGRLAREDLQAATADRPDVGLRRGRFHLDDFGSHPVGRA